MDKSDFRKSLRARRKSLSQADIAQASQQMCENLIQLPQLADSKHIALYCPFAGEINPLAILNKLTEKCFYLPVVGDNFTMDFRPFADEADCNLNKYGILEPKSQHSIDPLELDLVIVPLVGFDQQRHRLGMGGGYYDRAFANRTTTPILIGVAYHWQQIDDIQAEPWDVDLDAIVTDKGIIV